MHAEITSSGVHHRLTLDGVDVSGGCRHVTLDLEAGDVPELRLELVIPEVRTTAGKVDVIVPDDTRELLKQLGWTPPAEPED